MFPAPQKGYFPVLPNIRFSCNTAQRLLLKTREAVALSHNLLADMKRFSDETNLLIHYELGGFQRWMQSGCRLCYVDANSADACRQTETLKTVMGQDIRFVHPSVMFWFPVNRGFGKDSNEIFLVLAAQIEHPQLAIRYGHYTHNLPFPYNRFVLINAFWADQECQSLALPLYHDRSIFDMLNQYNYAVLRSELSRDRNLTKQCDIGREVANTVFSLFLIMQSYPEFVQELRTKRKMVNHKKAQSFTAYRISVGSLRQKINTLKHKGIIHSYSSRKSPKVHWRRGHWRRQYHGYKWEIGHPDKQFLIDKDRKHYHMHWIRPLLIGTT